MSSSTRNSRQPPAEHQSQNQHVRPDQNPNQYRNDVQTRVKNLLSGDRPRDPHLSTVTTGRLIFEGLVEELKIYRLHKEEKSREEVRKERERRRKDTIGETEGAKKRERHRERDEEGHRRRHRSRSRSSDDEEKRDEERERHTSKDRRHGHSEKHHHRRRHHHHKSRNTSCERSRSRSKHRHHRRRHYGSPVTEGPLDPDPERMMSGGAGPPGTLSPAPDQHQDHRRRRSRSRSRSPPLHRQSPRSSAPRGETLASELPKRAAGAGVVGHLVNTYKQIKAEHENVRRERGC
jgi:hypothetical protein